MTMKIGNDDPNDQNPQDPAAKAIDDSKDLNNVLLKEKAAREAGENATFSNRNLADQDTWGPITNKPLDKPDWMTGLEQRPDGQLTNASGKLNPTNAFDAKSKDSFRPEGAK